MSTFKSLLAHCSPATVLCFQHLTNPSAQKRLTIDFQPLYFQRFTNPFFSNPFVFSSIQNARVSPLHFPLGDGLAAAMRHSFPLSLRGPTSRSQSLKTRRIISLRASGANHGSRQEKQIAEIRRQG